MNRGSDWDVRTAALFAARDAGDLDYLLETLARDREPAPAAAKWLADAGDARAVPYLLRLLRAENVDARRAAARGLYRLTPPSEAREHLLDAARADDDSAVRGWAISALGRLGDPSLLPELIDSLNSLDWPVRQSAAGALGDTGDPAALPALRQARRRARRRPVYWLVSRPAYRDSVAKLEHLTSSSDIP